MISLLIHHHFVLGLLVGIAVGWGLGSDSYRAKVARAAKITSGKK